MPATSPLRESAAARAPERDDAYASLEAPDTLPVLSLLAFAAALAARPLARLLPRELRVYPWGPMLPLVIGVAASIAGVALAAWSLRRSPGRGVARLALLLNGVVLALTVLAALVMVRIVTR